ncbi:NAD(P)H-hydrate dehydratase [Poseidonibacter lekithochrous]|uniref:NAD(P)H-hydrate dehydratase n=1 Tax=Poseidonibacter lekithochrous TaxID=1904463 RepID=UPI000D384750|nr:NAD(P)H-hydrate dehydratase [Poseidonibacter lekithochrous]
MQKIFDELNSLDKRCYEEFALTEDILMEHAANAMSLHIQENYQDKKTILIVCGSGNNGADGIALARLLYKKYKINLYLSSQPKSKMAILQYKRVQLLGINTIDTLEESDIVIDCIFGSGLNRALDKNSIKLIEQLNSFDSVKISCDIPSGINSDGQVEDNAFFADTTITMGALKTSLYTDVSKDYVGNVIVANLGLSREIYEVDTNKYLLEEKDIILPFRNKKNTHKGSYGHLNVVVGCKKGAGIIAAKAAFGFGAGLVSVVSHEDLDLPYHIMQSHFLSENCSAIGIGMGLGKYELNEVKKILSKDIPTIIDADLFYEDVILDVLHKDVVLTPHPKEFCALLKLCDIANINIDTLQANRFLYVEKFTNKYPNVILLLKGANVIIANDKTMYINPLGSSILSKGGSGDVLSGLIASLLAQRYKPLDAAIHASLAHTLAASKYKKNDYSLIPSDLVEEVKKL